MDLLLWLTSAPTGLPQATAAAILLKRVAATTAVGLPLEHAAVATLFFEQATAAAAALLAQAVAAVAMLHLEHTAGAASMWQQWRPRSS